MICGTLIQTVILAWVTFRTDWTKEVSLCIPANVHLYFTDMRHFNNDRILCLL